MSLFTDKTSNGSLGASLSAVDESKKMLDEMLERRDKENAEKPYRSNAANFDNLKHELKTSLTKEEETEEKSEDLGGLSSDENIDGEDSDKDLSSYHVLNEQLQAKNQRDEQFQRQFMAEQQALREQLQRAQQPQQPAREELNPEDYGFADADHFNRLVGHLEQKFSGQLEQRVKPILEQAAQSNFWGAVESLGKEYEHFDKHFSREQLSGYFNGLSQKFPIDQLAKINWRGELANAYHAADYQRLKAEYEKLQKTGSSSKDVAAEAERKKNLGQVPKASARSAPSKVDPWDEMHQGLPSSRRIVNFAKRVKKHYGLG